MSSTEQQAATDQDIEDIVRENEAGVADVFAAHERSEYQYFRAVAYSTPMPEMTYSTSTASQDADVG